MKANIKDHVKTNRDGWWALQHKDGWWVGTPEGVTCYDDKELARCALTIAWQRDGGRSVDYRIREFNGEVHDAGEHTPKYSATEALSRYERRQRP